MHQMIQVDGELHVTLTAPPYQGFATIRYPTMLVPLTVVHITERAHLVVYMYQHQV
jgi:hypothetical protein